MLKNSKILRDEVENLITEVKNNSLTYTKIIEDFNKAVDDLNNEYDSLISFKSDIKSDIEEGLTKIESSFQNQVQQLDESINYVINLDYDLQEIENSKIKLQELINQFQNQSHEFSQSFVQFKIEKSEDIKNELVELTKEIKNQFNQESDNNIKFINAKAREIQKNIDLVERKVFEVNNDFQVYKLKNDNELDSLNTIFTNTKKLVESLIERLRNDIYSTEATLLKKHNDLILQLEEFKRLENIDDLLNIDTSIAELKNIIESNNDSNLNRINNFENITRKINKKVSEIDDKFAKEKTRSYVSMTISILSLLAVLIILAFA